MGSKTIPAGREVNHKQEAALNRIAKDDPKAKVVGWVDRKDARGPIIHKSDATIIVVNVTGYPKRY